MTTSILENAVQPGGVLSALSGQQLQALVENVRAQLPVQTPFDGDDALKDSLLVRSEPMAQGVVSALGLASIALMSQARAEQDASDLSPLRLALEALDQALLNVEPELMGLAGEQGLSNLGALQAEAGAMDWTELVATVQDLSQSVAGSDLAADNLLAVPSFAGVTAVMSELPVVDQMVGQALPTLETALADAGVPVASLLGSGALEGVGVASTLNVLNLLDASDLSAALSPVLDTVTDTVDTALDVVNGVTDTVVDTVGGVVESVTDAVEGLLGGDTGPLGELTEVTQDVLEAVDNTLDTTLDLLGDTADSLVDLVGDTSELLLDTVEGVLDLGGGLLSPETGLLSGLAEDADLVGLVSDVLDVDAGLLGDTAPVDGVLGDAVAGDLLAPVSDTVEVLTEVVGDVTGLVSGDGGLLGGLT
jgi:hypothetical protein